MIRGRGTALVLAGADCLWDDLARLEAMMGGPWPGIVLAVNNAGFERDRKGRLWEGPLHHWCTLHVEKLAGWKRQREALGLSMQFETWTHVRRTATDHAFPGWIDGSSGLYAVSVALEALKHPRVIGCGMPLTADVNVFTGRAWTSHKRYRRGFVDRKAALRNRFRSFGGWTGEVFGMPTVEWIGIASTGSDV